MLFVPMLPPVPRPNDPPQTEPNPEDVEWQRLIEWRTAHLEALGLSYPVAMELALKGADWHRIERAMGQGMTAAQVAAVFL